MLSKILVFLPISTLLFSILCLSLCMYLPVCVLFSEETAVAQSYDIRQDSICMSEVMYLKASF